MLRLFLWLKDQSAKCDAKSFKQMNQTGGCMKSRFNSFKWCEVDVNVALVCTSSASVSLVHHNYPNGYKTRIERWKNETNIVKSSLTSWNILFFPHSLAQNNIFVRRRRIFPRKTWGVGMVDATYDLWIDLTNLFLLLSESYDLCGSLSRTSKCHTVNNF